ncbi:MAG: hypothetical protein DCC75_05730 [Proteobacteria bacterium]|nr:MAG: hypothetical protein DCC75_05730 [Pseudomonadota bacterium]
MRRYKVTVNGKEHEVTLLARSISEIRFKVGQHDYTVSVKPDQNYRQALLEAGMQAVAASARPHAAALNPAARNGSSPHDVVAPMPGIVVGTPIQVGEQIAAGQTIAIIEAMKMENNIPAPASGIVKAVHVKAGQEVNGGQVLVSLAPAA